jgi:hypothetical protein
MIDEKEGITYKYVDKNGNRKFIGYFQREL